MLGKTEREERRDTKGRRKKRWETRASVCEREAGGE